MRIEWKKKLKIQKNRIKILYVLNLFKNVVRVVKIQSNSLVRVCANELRHKGNQRGNRIDRGGPIDTIEEDQLPLTVPQVQST